MKHLTKVVFIIFTLLMFAVGCSSSDELSVARPTLPGGNEFVSSSDSRAISDDPYSGNVYVLSHSHNEIVTDVLGAEVKISRISDYDYLIEYPEYVSVEQVRNSVLNFFSIGSSVELTDSRLVILDNTSSLLTLAEVISDEEFESLTTEFKASVENETPSYYAGNMNSDVSEENSHRTIDLDFESEAVVSENLNNTDESIIKDDQVVDEVEEVNSPYNPRDPSLINSLYSDADNYSVSFNVKGYPVVIGKVGDDLALIKYPSMVTDEELFSALSAVSAGYPDFIAGSGLIVLDSGKAILVAPQNFSADDLDYVEPILYSFIDDYVDGYMASGSEEVSDSDSDKSEIISETEIIPSDNNFEIVAELENSNENLSENEETVEYGLNVLGYPIRVKRVDDAVSELTYPSTVTDEEFLNAMFALRNEYPDFVAGSGLFLNEPGKAYIVTLFDYNADDLNYFGSSVQEFINNYVDNYLAALESDSADVPEESDETEAEELPIYNIDIEETVADSEEVEPESEEEAEYAFNILGYPVRIEKIDENVSLITYPSFITDEELFDGLSAVRDEYPSFVADSGLFVIEAGEAVAVTPYDYSADDLSYFGQSLHSFIDGYVASYVAAEPADNDYPEIEETIETTETAEELPIYNIDIEETVAGSEEVEPESEEEAEYAFNILGYPVRIEKIDENVSLITYPSFITDEELFDGLSAVRDEYPSFVADSGLFVIKAGEAVAVTPYDYSADDLSYFGPELSAYLNGYVEEYSASAYVPEVVDVVEPTSEDEHDTLDEDLSNSVIDVDLFATDDNFKSVAELYVAGGESIILEKVNNYVLAVSYPDYISDDYLISAYESIKHSYPEILDYSTIVITEPGNALIMTPSYIDDDSFARIEPVLQGGIDSYLASLLNPVVDDNAENLISDEIAAESDDEDTANSVDILTVNNVLAVVHFADSITAPELRDAFDSVRSLFPEIITGTLIYASDDSKSAIFVTDYEYTDDDIDYLEYLLRCYFSQNDTYTLYQYGLKPYNEKDRTKVNIDFFGSNVKIENVDDNVILVSYPSFISDADFFTSVKTVDNQYPGVLTGTGVVVLENGKALLVTPDNVTGAQLVALQPIIQSAVDNFADDYYARISFMKAEEERRAALDPKDFVFDVYGNEFVLHRMDNHQIVVEYPEDITEGELTQIAEEIYGSLSDYLVDSSLVLDEPGMATLYINGSVDNNALTTLTPYLQAMLDDYVPLYATSLNINSGDTDTSVENIWRTDNMVYSLDLFDFDVYMKLLDEYRISLVYPDNISDKEVALAAQAAVNMFPNFLADSKLEIKEPGLAVITSVIPIGEDDFDIFVPILNALYEDYITDYYYALVDSKAENRFSNYQAVSIKTEPDAIVELNVLGYPASIMREGNVGTVAYLSYPEEITDEELVMGILAIRELYPDLLAESGLFMLGDGSAVVALSNKYSSNDLVSAKPVLQAAIDGFVDYYVASLQKTEEVEPSVVDGSVDSVPEHEAVITIDIDGYPLNVAKVDDNVLTLNYPEWVRDEYVFDTLSALDERYSSLLDNSSVIVEDDSNSVLVLPYDVSDEDLSYSKPVLQAFMDEFVPYYVALLEKENAPETTFVASTVPEDEVEDEDEDEGIIEFFVLGESIKLEKIDDNSFSIKYPDSVPNNLIRDYASAVYQTYPAFFSNANLHILESGEAILSFDEPVSMNEMSLSASLISDTFDALDEVLIAISGPEEVLTSASTDSSNNNNQGEEEGVEEKNSGEDVTDEPAVPSEMNRTILVNVLDNNPIYIEKIGDNLAQFTYPDYIEDNQIFDALVEMKDDYPMLLDGTAVAIIEDSTGLLILPYDYTVDDLDSVQPFLQAYLDSYAEDYLAAIDNTQVPTDESGSEEQIDETVIAVTDPIEPVSGPESTTENTVGPESTESTVIPESTESTESTVAPVYDSEIELDVNGYPVLIKQIDSNMAEIIYPDFVTDDELFACVTNLKGNYFDYVDDAGLFVEDYGKALIIVGTPFDAVDLNFAEPILQAGLDSYLNDLVAGGLNNNGEDVVEPGVTSGKDDNLPGSNDSSDVINVNNPIEGSVPSGTDKPVVVGPQPETEINVASVNTEDKTKQDVDSSSSPVEDVASTSNLNGVSDQTETEGVNTSDDQVVTEIEPSDTVLVAISDNPEDSTPVAVAAAVGLMTLAVATGAYYVSMSAKKE